MKLLFAFLGILIILGVVILAEFSAPGELLFSVKTTVNDRLHVYQNTPAITPVATDTLEVSAELRAQLNEAFPADMKSFTERLRMRTSDLRTDLMRAGGSLEMDEVVVLQEINAADEALDKTVVALDAKAYEVAESHIETAVAAYLTAKGYLEQASLE